jgi:hypothetical protein
MACMAQTSPCTCVAPDFSTCATFPKLDTCMLSPGGSGAGGSGGGSAGSAAGAGGAGH